MKKYLLFLFLLLVLIGYGISKNEVDAISINFDYGNESPRFQYLTDVLGELIPFEFSIYDDFDTPEDIEEIEIRLEQVTYDGSFLKTLKIFTTDYYIYNSSIITKSSGNFIAGEDTTKEEYIYIGDVDFLTLYGVYVNSSLISSTNWEVDDTGDYIVIDAPVSTLGDTIYFDYRYEQSKNYISELYYDWSGLQEVFDEEVMFYRVRYNDIILMTGGVLPAPIGELEYDVLGIEYGDFLVTGDGEVDFSVQSDFTSYLVYDDYFILHYRIPESIINVAGYRTIHITDIITNTYEEVFTTNDILNIQGMSAYDYTFANSFIVIPLNGVLGEGLVISNTAYNDRYDVLLHNYEEGSYFIALVNQDTSNSLEANASVVWNITDDIDPFEMRVLKDEVALDDLQRLIFLKYNTLIYSNYSSTLAKDYALGVSYIDEVDDTVYTYAISYNLEESLVEGDCVTVGWDLEPDFIPYSLTASDYTINIRDQYCVIAETDIAGHINNSLIYYALDDEVGSIIFGIFVLLFVNLLMIFVTREMFIYAFVNLVIVLILSFMGLIPMWLIIGIFILGFIGFKFSLAGGGGNNYE